MGCRRIIARLAMFRSILSRQDFDFISDENQINAIIEAFRFEVNPGIIRSYRECLETFYGWVSYHEIPDIEIGYRRCQWSLGMAMVVSGQPVSAYRRKIAKRFLHGLSRIGNGLKVMFDPDILSFTSITKEQLIRFILDKEIGPGGMYLYNTEGKDSFVNKLRKLSLQELAVLNRLLLWPGLMHRRKTAKHGWDEIGRRSDQVRIIAGHGSNKLYYLFSVKDHGAFERALGTAPERAAFRAA